MVKYNIEGGLDFYAELYKSLDIEECEEKTDEDENKCLITNQQLMDKHVIMDCGHKFNYVPLYNDIINHKKKFNFMEGSHSKLNINEIRCPYCRKKQNHLLPYYNELGLEKVNGVNFYDPDLNQSHLNYYTSHKCEYIYPNPSYDIGKPETESNSKYLNNKSCYHYGATNILVYNKIKPLEPITYGDTKYYCYIHKKDMIKQYKLQQKEKEKNEKKNAKILEKEMKLLEKQAAKAKEREEKQKAKASKKKLPSKIKGLKKELITENVVLGPSNVETQTVCVQILKTGKNKGNPCGCKIVSENMCKRHYLLYKELNYK